VYDADSFKKATDMKQQQAAASSPYWINCHWLTSITRTVRVETATPAAATCLQLLLDSLPLLQLLPQVLLPLLQGNPQLL
jgi:hypothetical protein